MKRVQEALIWMAAWLTLAGCAAPAPTIEKPAGAAKPAIIERPGSRDKKDIGTVVPAPPPAERAKPPRPDEEGNLFFEGIALLNLPGQSDPARARAVFTALIERYPQSRWRSAAETVLRLLDEREASRTAGLQDRLLRERGEAGRSQMLQENDRLKKTVRELTEKLQTTTASLTQENEQLKKDLQRLKTLEIDLEKRDRMLR